ncbi:CCX3 [Symbiodinium natans]|uniref:CCX3 protein n=1 Tax=Symbiodinium natans TaxID=878477 RepID=A0A812JJI8_9DINO|nr:CCX3 [Symbiodinium natans]
MSTNLRRSDRMRRVVVQLLSGLGLIALLVVVLGSASTHYGYRVPCDGGDSDSQALFDYMSFYACSELLPSPVKAVLLLLWLGLLIGLLASTADDYFVPQLEALSHCLGLQEDVAGVTLLALGNGMPDVMTACSSINKANDLPLTMGEFLGAANFIVIFVLACILLVNPGPTEVDGWPFLRDSIACLLVVVFMVVITWDNHITLAESMSFFWVYAGYIALVLLPGRLCFRTAHARALESEVELVLEQAQMGSSSWADDEPTSPTDGSFLPLASESEAEDFEEGKLVVPGLQMYPRQTTLGLFLATLELPFTLARSLCIPSATWSQKERLLAAACPACGVLFMFLSYGGWGAFQASSGIPDWALALAAGSLASLAVLCASSPGHPPAWHLMLLLWAVATAVSWFNLLANECVAVLEAFGLNLGISSSVLGITVLAWGNSVGDLVADRALAKQGRWKMAVAGVYGSPILSDLLGLGVALTSHVWQHGALKSELSKQNRIAAGSLVVGVVLSVAVKAVVQAENGRSKRSNGYQAVSSSAKSSHEVDGAGGATHAAPSAVACTVASGGSAAASSSSASTCTNGTSQAVSSSVTSSHGVDGVGQAAHAAPSAIACTVASGGSAAASSSSSSTCTNGTSQAVILATPVYIRSCPELMALELESSLILVSRAVFQEIVEEWKRMKKASQRRPETK